MSDDRDFLITRHYPCQCGKAEVKDELIKSARDAETAITGGAVNPGFLSELFPTALNHDVDWITYHVRPAPAEAKQEEGMRTKGSWFG